MKPTPFGHCFKQAKFFISKNTKNRLCSNTNQSHTEIEIATEKKGGEAASNAETQRFARGSRNKPKKKTNKNIIWVTKEPTALRVIARGFGISPENESSSDYHLLPASAAKLKVL